MSLVCLASRCRLERCPRAPLLAPTVIARAHRIEVLTKELGRARAVPTDASLAADLERLVASTLGLVASDQNRQASCSASKEGLIHLTHELAAYWARRDIRVNATAPGRFSS